MHKNLWSYPKSAQKIYRYSQKSTKIFEAILKVHKKSLDIILKRAQKIFQAMLKVHKKSIDIIPKSAKKIFEAILKVH